MAEKGIKPLVSDFVAVRVSSGIALDRTGVKTASKGDSFKSYMNKETGSTAKESSVNAAKESTVKVNPAKESPVKDTDKVKQEEGLENEAGKPEISADKSKGEALDPDNQIEETDISQEDIAVMAVAMAQMAEAAADLKEAIAQAMGITSKELSDAMKELGIEQGDLFDTENLGKLVLWANGLKNPQDLLVNAEAAADFKEIVSLMQEAKGELEELGIDLSKLTEQGTSAEMLPEENMSVNGDILNADTESNVSESFESDGGSVEESADTFGQNAGAGQTEGTDTNAGGSTNNSNLQQDSGAEKNDGKSQPKARSYADAAENGLNVRYDPIQNIEAELTDRVGRLQADSIINQLSEQIKLNVNSSFKSMELQLYPESLGKVGVQVAVKNGVLTAQLTAENEAVKRVIEAQLTSLKDSFNNQGLKVENVEVVIAGHDFSENDMQKRGDEQQQRGRRGRRFSFSLMDDGDLSTEQASEQDIMEALGNTVSYTA